MVMKHGLLFVLVSVAGIQVLCGCFQKCGCGGLDKSDPYLFIGEYLNMTCTLNADVVRMGYNSSNLVFRYTDNMEYVEASENETTAINSSSLVLHKKMTSLTERESYQCCLTNYDSNKTLVGITIVELEYPPQNITNFSCIFYDWYERLTCMVDLGVQYKNPHNIEISLIMNSRIHKVCGFLPNQQLTNSTWTKNDGVTFDKSELHFVVTVNNTKLNVSFRTDWISIKQQENVKPSQVYGVNAMTLNSTCIMLEWSHNKEARNKTFIVTYTSKWNENQLVVYSKENSNKTFERKICNLKPNTMYNFKIVTVPGINQSYHYPSDPVNSVNTTDIDVPSRPPEISGGSYMVSKDGCQNGRKAVTLYWKSVPEEFQNGPMKGYQISVNNSYCDQFKESSQCAVDVEPNVLEKSFEIPCDQQTTFFIRSIGAAGMSINDSAISITVDHDILRPKQVIVEAQMNTTDTSVSLSWDWNPVLDRPVKSCTVYYCQYDTKCTNEISWKDVHNNTHTLIEDVKFDRKYRFGVSCNGSGFKWQTCYYFKNMEPSPPSTVKVRAFPDDAITIDWSDPECEKSPYITNYRVTWCAADRTTKTCKDPSTKKMSIIPSTEPSSYVIQDVVVNTLYAVAVQFQARDDNWSVESDVKLVQPTNSDWKPDEIVGASVGGTFVLAFFIAGILFCYRKCRSQIEVYSKPFDIKTVDIKTSKMDKEYTTQISTDSGNESLPTPVKDENLNGLLSNQEESLRPKNSESSLCVEFKKKADQSLDISYATITMSDQLIPVTHTPVKNQGTSSLASNMSTYKSSSEEKMLNKENKKDNEGSYIDLDGNCKSLGTLLSRRSLPDDCCVDSYVQEDIVGKKEYLASEQQFIAPFYKKECLNYPSNSSENKNEDSSSVNAGYVSERFVQDNNITKYDDTNSSPYISDTKMIDFFRDDTGSKQEDDTNSSPYISDTKMIEFPRDDTGSKQEDDTNSSPYISDTKMMEFPRDDTGSKQGDDTNSSPYLSDNKMMEFPRDDTGSKQRDDTNSSPYISDTKMMEFPVCVNEGYESDESVESPDVTELFDVDLGLYLQENDQNISVKETSNHHRDEYDTVLLKNTVDNSVDKVNSENELLNRNNMNCKNSNDCFGVEYDKKLPESNLHTNEDYSSESSHSFGYVSHELLQ